MHITNIGSLIRSTKNHKIEEFFGSILSGHHCSNESNTIATLLQQQNLHCSNVIEAMESRCGDAAATVDLSLQ